MTRARPIRVAETSGGTVRPSTEELAQRLEDKSVATGHLIYGLTVDESTCMSPLSPGVARAIWPSR